MNAFVRNVGSVSDIMNEALALVELLARVGLSAIFGYLVAKLVIAYFRNKLHRGLNYGIYCNPRHT